jgi:uridine kinase
MKTQIPKAVLIDKLAITATQLHTSRPSLVAIDGRSAAGKTTLADELARRIAQKGRSTLRSSIDHFHPPGHKYRSRSQPYTPESYYTEGYDYAKFRQCVLDPLQKNGSRRCLPAYWDSYTDRPFPEQWVEVTDDVVAIVDGIFLRHPTIRHYWDYFIWLDISWDTMVERAADRDSAWVGNKDIVVERYRSFWIPTHRSYESLTTPKRDANIIVDNTNPESPILVINDQDITS